MAITQALLRVGIVRSKRAPTKTHPYGYMKDKFVWSLVSAVGIFCLGAGVTCAHGVSSLLSPPQQLAHLGYGLAGAPPPSAPAVGHPRQQRCICCSVEITLQVLSMLPEARIPRWPQSSSHLYRGCTESSAPGL